MSDELNFNNPEEQSIDELIEETKRQIADMDDEFVSDGVAEAMEDDATIAIPIVSEAPSFEPDFGDAFKDYGIYEEPALAPMAKEQPEEDFEPDFGDEFKDYGDYEAPCPDVQPEENIPLELDEKMLPLEDECFLEVQPEPEAQDSLGFENVPEDALVDELSEDGDLGFAEGEVSPAPEVLRPKKKKQKYTPRIAPIFVKLAIYVIIVGLIAVTLGYGLWEAAKDVMAFGRSGEQVTVVVSDKDTVGSIGKLLEENGVIKYPWLFKTYCSFTDSGDAMVAHVDGYENYGIYSIYYNYDYHALTKAMVANRVNCQIFRISIPDEDGNEVRKIRVAFSKSLVESQGENSTSSGNKMNALRLMVQNQICTTDEILLLAQQGGVCSPEEIQSLKSAVSGTVDVFALMERDGICSGEELFSLMDQELTGSTIRLTIPEGMTCAQIFAMMEESGICSVEDLEACAAETEFDYWFLEGVPTGEKNRLEGFLFPDTYDFYGDDAPERVLNKLLTNFNRKFTEDAQAQLEVLNGMLADKLSQNGYGEDYIASHRLTVRELIIVASMIEKETAGADESGEIASVIYNRLTNPGNFPYLNIDAAIIYALGGVDGALTQEDLKIDSPYNTYTHAGLPVGPISNPGLSSIAAALYPSDTKYYFYALDKEIGFHHFSESYDEHNSFLAGQNDE